MDRTHREPDPQGLAAARRVAGYEIGDPSWADLIVAAYLNPAEALEALAAQTGKDDQSDRPFGLDTGS